MLCSLENVDFHVLRLNFNKYPAPSVHPLRLHDYLFLIRVSAGCIALSLEIETLHPAGKLLQADANQLQTVSGSP